MFKGAVNRFTTPLTFYARLRLARPALQGFKVEMLLYPGQFAHLHIRIFAH
jgi:NAD(P)H-flavin reductase